MLRANLLSIPRVNACGKLCLVGSNLQRRFLWRFESSSTALHCLAVGVRFVADACLELDVVLAARLTHTLGVLAAFLLLRRLCLVIRHVARVDCGHSRAERRVANI